MSVLFRSNKEKNSLLSLKWMGIVIAVCILGVAVWDTKIVPIKSKTETGFSVEDYARNLFPQIKQFIESKAIDAETLAKEIIANKSQAVENYGVKVGIGAVLPVSLTGKVVNRKNSIVTVAIDGVPEVIKVRVQIGPAINGTAVRDATGRVSFNQFKNQIEYQNVGSGLNEQVKNIILDQLDRDNLLGKTISVSGVFNLINIKSWLITPVKLEVSQ
ncbi:DUF2291 domain-containing protein [Photobacterium sp. GJ3]|uniref:DUF2291 family protein n=1 Tax=Photobacterium sp. GJ3 TaxID=2829502 RepID=UPI001B8B5A5C|nr:DUF2291 domain-containing protein [Photobacterium sp. GJ3]QUJ66451.1 DUF2291 domain-containing protein [Photobacterium sp. GJ3]